MEDTMPRFCNASPLSLLAAITMLLPAFFMPTVAHAALNDDDLICYIVGTPPNEDIECDEVGRIKAQCDLMDAQPGEIEVCDDARTMLITPLSLTGSTDGGGGGAVPGGSHTPSGLGFTSGKPALN
jgi:hypothetical protein